MKDLIIKTEVQKDSVKISLTGALILMDALKLKSELAILAQSYNSLEIDMHGVTKVDLTGLNALISAKVNAKEGSNGIVLDVPKGHPVFELLQLTKFTDQFLFNQSNIV